MLKFLLWLVFWPITIVGDKMFVSEVRLPSYVMGIAGLLLAFKFAGTIGARSGLSPLLFVLAGMLLYLLAGFIPYIRIVSNTALSE